MKKIGIAVLVLFLAAVTWHGVVVYQMERSIQAVYAEVADSDFNVEMSINPLTNVVGVRLNMESGTGDVWSDIGTSLAETLIQVGGPQYLERELAVSARERFDLYAMAMPYRVRIVTTRAPATDPIHVEEPSGSSGSWPISRVVPPTPKPPIVTLEEFNRVQLDMYTYPVQNLIGAPGEVLSRTESGYDRTIVYTWVNPDGSSMTATFRNGRLKEKRQSGLR